MKIPERDWKNFRRLQGVALERFCQRVLDECQATASDTSRSAHERYLAVFRLIQERDRELADAFDNPRRSTAILTLTLIRSHGLLTEEEVG
ncbi:MAG: hypothetical protein V5A50_10800 [Thiohalorhabdus sp.]|uniref:hypothetical protein n=1 Tax=Thiohalorhabdus sp. TaxID=3094134 RepID=UPI002FC28C9A